MCWKNISSNLLYDISMIDVCVVSQGSRQNHIPNFILNINSSIIGNIAIRELKAMLPATLCVTWKKVSDTCSYA
jgi:hypothetical protein